MEIVESARKAFVHPACTKVDLVQVFPDLVA